CRCRISRYLVYSSLNRSCFFRSCSLSRSSSANLASMSSTIIPFSLSPAPPRNRRKHGRLPMHYRYIYLNIQRYLQTGNLNPERFQPLAGPLARPPARPGRAWLALGCGRGVQVRGQPLGEALEGRLGGDPLPAEAHPLQAHERAVGGLDAAQQPTVDG